MNVHLRAAVMLVVVINGAAGATYTYGLQEKPPAVVLRASNGSEPFRIALTAAASIYFTPLINGEDLYILHEPKKKGSSGAVSIVDLRLQKVRHVVPVAWGRHVKIIASKDGSHILCEASGGPSDINPRPDEGTKLTVIATGSGEITATYVWDGAYGSVVDASDDDSHVLVASKGIVRSGVSTGQELALFSAPGSTPSSKAALNFALADRLLSSDGTQLFLIGSEPTDKARGRDSWKHLGARLAVINRENGHVLKNEPIGDGAPLRFTRLKGHEGTWIVAEGWMRHLSDLGVLDDKVISFEDAQVMNGAGSAPAKLDGVPGSVIGVGPDKAAILVESRSGISGSRQLILVDLKARRLVSIIETHGKGQEQRHIIGQSLKLFSAAAVSLGAMGSGIMLSESDNVVPRADGAFLYVLDPLTNEVNIIKTSDGGLVRRVPVSADIRKIYLRAGSDLVCEGAHGVQVIDTELNDIRK